MLSVKKNTLRCCKLQNSLYNRLNVSINILIQIHKNFQKMKYSSNYFTLKFISFCVIKVNILGARVPVPGVACVAGVTRASLGRARVVPVAARLRLGGRRRAAGADGEAEPARAKRLIRLAAAAGAAVLRQTVPHHERVLHHPAVQRRQRRRLLHRVHLPADAGRQLGGGRVRRHGRAGRGAPPHVADHVRAAAAAGPSAAGARLGRRHRPQPARPGRLPALRTASLGRWLAAGLDARAAAGRLHVLRVHRAGAAAVGDDRRGLPGCRPRRRQRVNVLHWISRFLRRGQIGPSYVRGHRQRRRLFRLRGGGGCRRRFLVLLLSRDKEPDAAGD